MCTFFKTTFSSASFNSVLIPDRSAVLDRIAKLDSKYRKHAKRDVLIDSDSSVTMIRVDLRGMGMGMIQSFTRHFQFGVIMGYEVSQAPL
jgi:hypothetical protein